MKLFYFSHVKRASIIIFIVAFSFPLTVRAQTKSLIDYFPDIKITDSNGPEPGYFFVSSKTLESASDTFYLAIFDNYGTPLFFRLMPGLCTGFTVQPNGFLTYTFGKPRKIFMMDSLYQVVDTVVTEGYKIDPHGYYVTADGHALLFGNKRRTVDMSAIVEGGDPAATIRDKVVQEFDESGNLLYTWKFWEHYEITDANENSPFVDLTASTIDYAHPNDITTDSDTSFLISNRHMDEVTKVDRRTGDIIWRLGGENNGFTFVDDSFHFSHQHSISILSNGNLLLFDNGNLHDPSFSSTVEYQLDEVNKTATLITRIRRVPNVFSEHSGCTQRLPNGNTLIGWGPFVPSATEFFPDGSRAIEIDFSNHSFSNPITKFPWKQKVFETNKDSVDFGMWDGYTESFYLLNITNNLTSAISITSYSTNTEHFSI
ncbi:MAG: aryl-sulfate sulfotransferase, partial [Bacteroidales bacterium]|nr:aryl-sulfate sulfotransferase [Bacteroidales bacterium]